jgi:hypothetical protein
MPSEKEIIRRRNALISGVAKKRKEIKRVTAEPIRTKFTEEEKKKVTVTPIDPKPPSAEVVKMGREYEAQRAKVRDSIRRNLEKEKRMMDMDDEIDPVTKKKSWKNDLAKRNRMIKRVAYDKKYKAWKQEYGE